MSAPARRNFIAGDPLRGLAAMSVVVFHIALGVATPLGGLPGGRAFGPLTGDVLNAMRSGLFIFFVLSGYLLAAPFVRAYAAGSSPPRLARYLRHRVLRIVPAFWAAAAVTLLLFGRRGSSWPAVGAIFGFAQAWFSSPLTDYIAQAWTLGVELAFYLLLPLGAAALTLLTPRRASRTARLALVIVAAAALAAASLGLRATGYDAAGFYYRFPVMLWAFAPGIALAVAEVALAGRILKGDAWRWIALLGVATAALAFAALCGSVDFQLADPLYTGVFSTALVGGALVKQWHDGTAWRVLDNRVMRYLGERSYAIYLVHVAVLWKLFVWAWERTPTVDPGVRFAGTLVLGVPVILLAAEALHRGVERPFLRLKDGLPVRRRRPNEPAAEAPGSPLEDVRLA